jgi:hypothetical protein
MHVPQLLLISTGDIIALTGMASAAVAAGFMVWRVHLVFARLGCVLAAATVWLGLANHGWRPFFGGSYGNETYFGCTMLVLGVLAFLLFGAIDEVLWALAPSDEQRAFPVITTENDSQ